MDYDATFIRLNKRVEALELRQSELEARLSPVIEVEAELPVEQPPVINLEQADADQLAQQEADANLQQDEQNQASDTVQQ